MYVYEERERERVYNTRTHIYESTCKLQSHNISNKHVNWSFFFIYFFRLSLTHMFDILEHCQRHFDHINICTHFSVAIYLMNWITDWKMNAQKKQRILMR